MRTIHRIALAAAGAAVLSPAAAGAQRPLLGGTVYGSFEAGLNQYLHRPALERRAWFELYRDIPAGPALEAGRLWWTSGEGRNLAELRAREAGQEDQSFVFRAQRVGTFRLEAAHTQAPRLFSTNARLPGTQPEPGVFVLPTPRPTNAQLDAAPLFGPVGVRWDADRVGLEVTPLPQWAVRAAYTRTRKEGEKPLGIAFGSPGSNYREVLEPIRHTVHDLRLTQSLALRSFRLNLGYSFSGFENDNTAIVADNPALAVDNATNGSSRGRTALAPTNAAHTVSAAGSVSLPLGTRVNATLSRGWRSQDEPLLPFTINSAINTSALGTLPAGLEGEVRTSLVALSATSRPLAPLWLTARWRRYELDDRTPAVTLAGRVSNDRSLSTTAVTAERFSYTRSNAGVEARVQPLRPLSVRFGYDWEQWERDPELRDALRTDEYTPKVSVDLRLLDRVQLHGSYAHSRRRGDSVAVHPADELAGLRRFDVADRDRDRANVALVLLPLDVLDVTLAYGFGEREYPHSEYGVQREKETSRAVEVGLTPSDRVTLFGSWVRERFDARQRSRYRATGQLDNLTYDWVADNAEAITTVGVGGNVRLVPGKLDLTVAWDRSRGTSRMRAFNPQTPTGGTAAQNASATAADLPELEHTLSPANAYLRWRMAQSWVATLRYTHETFRQTDFRSDGLLPVTGNDLVLGGDLENYRARLLTLTFSYTPWIRGSRVPPF